MTDSPALLIDCVTKSYGAVQALKGVSFSVLPGEVHALVGENGAGKSTLMGVAAGTVTPDAGTVVIQGRPLRRASAREAEQLGLVVVYQDPALVEELTVLENLLLAMPPDRRPSRDATAWGRAQLDRLQLGVELDVRVGELVPGDRQLLEIAKALAIEPSVLVLDEPTESLGAEAVDRLMELIRAEADRGTAVVYISHRIAEVRRIADRITALRDGRITGTALARDVDDDDIVEMVVGRSLDALFPDKAQEVVPASGGLALEALTGAGFHDVSLQVRPGEIVGLAGVEGNGQRELLRAVAGLNGVTEGRISLDGRDVQTGSPRLAAASGIHYTSADRHAEGMFGVFSVRENISSASLGRLSRAGVVSARREREAVAAQMQATAIKASSAEAGVLTLSGGNQQKVMFAKAMLAEPAVMLCDEPTRGVDVGARSEIYDLLRGLALDGHPVLVLSADAAELAGLCDRVVVFSHGTIAAAIGGDAVTEDAIVGAALRATRIHVTDTDSAAAPRAPRRRWRRALRGDSFPALLLLALALAIALAVNGSQPAFLSAQNIPLVLYGTAILGFIALGQHFSVLTGGMDLSVGPMAGLLVVVMSFVLAEGEPLGVGLLVCLAVALLLGGLNAVLVSVLGISAIISTLGTFIGFQGVSLLLRDQVGGQIDPGFIRALTTQIGPIPVAFLVVLAVAIVAELVSRRTRLGYALRAVGPGARSATRMGVRVRAVVFTAYVLTAVMTLCGALLLAAQIGTGDGTAGTGYTLTSISAVVLGGASIAGGRGSFLGTFAGAVVFALVANATTFVGLDQGWQYWVPGAIILIAAAASARLDSVSKSKEYRT